MKILSILTLSIFFLFSCSQEANKQGQTKLTNSEISSDTSNEVTANDSIEKQEFKVRARFLEFYFGDAEHYSFENESGEIISFDGCVIDNFEFSRELEDSEANAENQGWGSNTELQGKWFILTYISREQPMYIDGPMGTASIITKAVLDEK